MQFLTEDLVELSYGAPPEGYELIQNTIVDVSRWSIIHNMIFKYSGKYYRSVYSRGATEMQDEGPYSDEGEFVECYEVSPVEKIMIEYINVES
jgi:hypothetical protein